MAAFCQPFTKQLRVQHVVAAQQYLFIEPSLLLPLPP